MILLKLQALRQVSPDSFFAVSHQTPLNYPRPTVASLAFDVIDILTFKHTKFEHLLQ